MNMEKMKVEGSRTGKFRDTVKQMAQDIFDEKLKEYNELDGYELNKQEIHFNIDKDGYIKNVLVNGIVRNDVLAYFYITVYQEKGSKYKSEDQLNVITNSDYIKYSRKVKLSKLNGNEIKIKKTRKPVEGIDDLKDEYKLEVGKLYGIQGKINESDNNWNHIIKIVGITKTTYKFSFVKYSVKPEFLDKRDIDIDTDIIVEGVEKKVYNVRLNGWKFWEYNNMILLIKETNGTRHRTIRNQDIR